MCLTDYLKKSSTTNSEAVLKTKPSTSSKVSLNNTMSADTEATTVISDTTNAEKLARTSKEPSTNSKDNTMSAGMEAASDMSDMTSAETLAGTSQEISTNSKDTTTETLSSTGTSSIRNTTIVIEATISLKESTSYKVSSTYEGSTNKEATTAIKYTTNSETLPTTSKNFMMINKESSTITTSIQSSVPPGTLTISRTELNKKRLQK